jgi:hypothetical protein
MFASVRARGMRLRLRSRPCYPDVLWSLTLTGRKGPVNWRLHVHTSRELAIQMARNIRPQDLKQQLSPRNSNNVPKTSFSRELSLQYESLDVERGKFVLQGWGLNRVVKSVKVRGIRGLRGGGIAPGRS